jgi:hypothetical protein
MSLKNISFCRYLADIRFPWGQANYDVAKIVRALKEEEFNGYADLRFGTTSKRLTPENPLIATEWFVETVKEQVRFSEGSYILCPIPDSQCTPTSTHVPRTLRLAQALSQRIPRLKVWHHLKFAKPMPRKLRNEEFIYQNMVCPEQVPVGYLILLDDVCTTGAHARAAQRRLLQCGGQRMCAMSVARTIIAPEDKLFGFREDTL